jgi:hypothetical protein
MPRLGSRAWTAPSSPKNPIRCYGSLGRIRCCGTKRCHRTPRLSARGLARIKTTGAEVVLIDPQYAPRVIVKPNIEGMVALIATAAKAEHVLLFHRSDLMRHWHETDHLPFETFVSSDELHMNDWSYACLAKGLALAIAEAATRPTCSFAFWSRPSCFSPSYPARRKRSNSGRKPHHPSERRPVASANLPHRKHWRSGISSPSSDEARRTEETLMSHIVGNEYSRNQLGVSRVRRRAGSRRRARRRLRRGAVQPHQAR